MAGINVLSIDSIKGKTIANAVDWCEYIALTFTDGCIAVFKGGDYYGMDQIHVINPDGIPMSYKFALGLITEEEYDVFEKSQQQIKRNDEIAKEREEYERLKAKYEGGEV